MKTFSYFVMLKLVSLVLLLGIIKSNDKFDYQEEFIIDRLEPKIQDLLKTKTEGANAALSTVLKNSAIASVTVSM